MLWSLPLLLRDHTAHGVLNHCRPTRLLAQGPPDYERLSWGSNPVQTWLLLEGPLQKQGLEEEI